MSEQLPEEEIRTRQAAIFATMRISAQISPDFPPLWKVVDRILNYSNYMVKVKRILARVIRCWGKKKSLNVVSADPTCDELTKADRLILVSAMPSTATAYVDQKLDSLMPEKQGMVIVTKGRLGEECLSAHLGVTALPILMPNTRAA